MSHFSPFLFSPGTHFVWTGVHACMHRSVLDGALKVLFIHSNVERTFSRRERKRNSKQHPASVGAFAFGFHFLYLSRHLSRSLALLPISDIDGSSVVFGLRFCQHDITRQDNKPLLSHCMCVCGALVY